MAISTQIKQAAKDTAHKSADEQRKTPRARSAART